MEREQEINQMIRDIFDRGIFARGLDNADRLRSLNKAGYRDEKIVRKEAIKEILQHFMDLPVCQHPTISTGCFTFGKKYIKELAAKFEVEVEE